MKKVSSENVKILIEEYNNGFSCSELGRKYGVSHSAISGLLSRRGIKIRNNKIDFTEVEKQEIINLYLSGKGTVEISKKYSVSFSWVNEFLKSRNVKIRNRSQASRIFKINEHYFDKIDSEEKAYWLGFIFADGCNTRKGFTISISRKDKDHLNKIKNVLYDDNRYNIKDAYAFCKGKKYKISQFWLTSKYLSGVLSGLGAIPAKSLVLKFPEWIDKLLIRHFIRGYFDGDGCLHVYRNRATATFSLIGTNEFLNSVNSILKNKIGLIECCMSKRNRVWYLTTTRHNNLKLIYDWFYSDADLFLSRKKEKFIEYFNKKRKRYE